MNSFISIKDISLPYIFLCLYIFFMYNSYLDVFPSVMHSLILLGMIGFVLLGSFIKQNIYLSIFTLWYLLFCFTGVCSVTFYVHSDIVNVYRLIVTFIITLCFILEINSRKKLEGIANVYVFSSIVMALLIWLSGALDFLRYQEMTEDMRLGGDITGNANSFSTLFMFAGVFSAWLFIFEKKKWTKVLYLICFLSILVIMALSGGRKTMFSVFMAFSVFLLMKEDKNRKKVLKNICLLIILAVLLIYILLEVPFFYNLIGERFIGLFDLFTGQHNVEAHGDDMRKRIFSLALNGWLENPIFGHGFDSFKFYNLRVTGHNYYAHNNYVELLYDLGLVGFLLYYYIYIYIYCNLRKLTSIDYKFKILGYGLLIELLIFDFGGVSYYATENIVILALAYVCSVKDKSLFFTGGIQIR